MSDCYLLGSGNQGVNVNIKYSEVGTNIAEWPYLAKENSQGAEISTSSNPIAPGYDLTAGPSNSTRREEVFDITLVPGEAVCLKCQIWKDQSPLTSNNENFTFKIKLYKNIDETIATEEWPAPKDSSWSTPYIVPDNLAKAEVIINWGKPSTETSIPTLFIQPQISYIKLSEEERGYTGIIWKNFVKDNPDRFPEYEPYSRRTKKPSINTIWIDGPYVPEWAFDIKNPYTSDGKVDSSKTLNTTKDGSVWFETGVTSTAAFNISKTKNKIMMYPSNCYQYAGGQWNRMFPESFIIPQDETEPRWVPWKPVLYNAGVGASSWSGGYISNYCIGNSIEWGHNGSYNQTVNIKCNIKVNTRLFQTLKFSARGCSYGNGAVRAGFYINSTQEVGGKTVGISLPAAVNSYSSVKDSIISSARSGSGYSNYTVDLTTLTPGEYYIGFYIIAQTSGLEGGDRGCVYFRSVSIE